MSNLTLSFSDLSTATWTLSRVWRKKSTLTSSFTDSLTAASNKFTFSVAGNFGDSTLDLK